MFALEIDFHDGISPPETILVRRSNAIVGSSDLAHVVVEGAASSLCELRLVRGLGREFSCLPVRRPGRGAVPPPFLEGTYPGEAELKLGDITFHVTAIDIDLSLMLDEFPDRAAIRILRTALTFSSPVFPAVAVLGAKPIYVSFSPSTPLLIGRSRKCGLRLDASDVSSEHARIGMDGDRCWIEDLGSTNGTYVGSERISGRRYLERDETVSIASEFLIALVLNKEDVANLSSQVKRYPEPSLGKSYPCILGNSDSVRPIRYAVRPRSKITIGRDPSNDIWISAAHISRSHIEISADDDNELVVTDMSSNGTFLKGKRLPRGLPTELGKNFSLLDLCSGILLGVCYSEDDENAFAESVQPKEEVRDVLDVTPIEPEKDSKLGVDEMSFAGSEFGKSGPKVFSEHFGRGGGAFSKKDSGNLSSNVFERLAKRPSNRAQDPSLVASEENEHQDPRDDGQREGFENYHQPQDRSERMLEQFDDDSGLLAEAEFNEDLLEGSEYGRFGRTLLMLLVFGLVVFVLFLIIGFFS